MRHLVVTQLLKHFSVYFRLEDCSLNFSAGGIMAARSLCGVLLFALFLHELNASSDESSVNQDLSNIFNELWRLDVNRMTPGIDYNISVQNKAGFVSQGSTVVRDQAPQPLFSSVNEDKMKRTTTFFLLMKLLDNYERSSSVSEQYSPEEITEISLFLDAVLETQVMKRTHQYLVNKGKSSSDLTTFKNQLNWIWFHLYNRQRNTSPDSCGFEHVFVGETRTGSEVAGFHNWVQFYLQEKSTHLDYKGFKAGHQDSPDSDDHVLNLQFSWHGAVKPVGSAFIGTSPEFEMAVFTVVFLMNTERSTKVVVDIDQCQLELLVVRHGNSIGTAFPKLLSSNSRHVRQQSR